MARTASRQELIALLWESDDEAKGRKNLRHALYTLNKELGGEVLLSPQKSVVVLNTQREIDCDYEVCPHAASCPIGTQITEFLHPEGEK